MLGVQLGVDHPGEHAADVVGRRRGTRDGLVDGRARVVGVRRVVPWLIKTGYILKICPPAGTVKP